jgi:hypothetical protein
MSPLLQRIASALVEATPEWWTEATMRVEFNRYPDGKTGMPHSIWSDQHQRDLVEPTDDIFAATYALHQLCEQAGQSWSALLICVELADGQWRFKTTFEYNAEQSAAAGGPRE